MLEKLDTEEVTAVSIDPPTENSHNDTTLGQAARSVLHKFVRDAFLALLIREIRRNIEDLPQPPNDAGK